MISREVRRLVVVLTVCGLMALTGCQSGSDDGPGADAASESPSSAPSSVRVPASTPTVEPADGPLISTEGATIRGLKGMRRVSDFGVLQGYRNDQVFLTIVPGFTDKTSLDAFAKLHQRVSKETDETVLERVDDAVVGGKYNAFHFRDVTDTSDPDEEIHEYGVLFLNGSWIIEIGFYNEGFLDEPPLTAQEREEVAASILATFEPTVN